MKKAVIAADSFKGSLSSLEVADAVEKGIFSVFPKCEIIKVPVADGGEGTMDALVLATKGSTISLDVYDPLMRPIKAKYGILGDSATAIIELAAASGLPLLSKEERNPLKTNTFGTGQLIADALKRGCRNILLAIGGSATNDGATGLLSALGFRFLDKNGKELPPIGENLINIEHIDTRNVLPEVYTSTFKVACDVKNPLFGTDGAAYVFAPQKGACPEAVKELDNGLRNLSKIFERELNKSVSTIPGAGAAGGTGAGVMALLNATLLPGIELILDTLHFNNIISGADLIITGEGRLDRQTAMGKTPAGIAKAAQLKGIPVIAIGGSIKDEEELDRCGINACFSILPRIMPLEEAMRPQTAKRNITRVISQICHTIQLSKTIEICLQ
ncbi:MAG: glycerate kinase [Bacteroidales bacterium]|nr:glycerate kinase [Bacteroidales bacterium]